LKCFLNTEFRGFSPVCGLLAIIAAAAHGFHQVIIRWLEIV
jgi:hypothetical protein